MSRINTATLLACCVPASIVLGMATVTTAGAETVAVVTASVVSVSVAWHGPKVLLAAAVKVAGAEPDPGTGRRRAQTTEGAMRRREPAGEDGRQEQSEEFQRTAVEQHAPSARRLSPDPYLYDEETVLEQVLREETEARRPYDDAHGRTRTEDLSARGSWDLPTYPASL